jgi:CheY-like chemotaxis protein
VLEKSGFEVVQAGSGEEALEICAQAGSRLRGVVLDLTMPVLAAKRRTGRSGRGGRTCR